MSQPMLSPLRTPRPPAGGILWPVAVALAIFVASGRSELAGPEGVPHLDKLVHFANFGLLATLTLRTFFSDHRRWRDALLATVIASLYGLADEFRQSFTPGRSVEFADWLADTAGAMLAATLYAFWPAWRRLLECPLGGRPARPGCPAAATRAAAPAEVTGPLSHP